MDLPGRTMKWPLLANNGLPGHVASTSAVAPAADLPGGEGPFLTRRCVTEMLYSALVGSIQRHGAKVLTEIDNCDLSKYLIPGAQTSDSKKVLPRRGQPVIRFPFGAIGGKVMSAAVKLREDVSAAELRAMARESGDSRQCRRLLALAAVRSTGPRVGARACRKPCLMYAAWRSHGMTL